MAEAAEMSLNLLSQQTEQERSQKQDQINNELQSSVKYYFFTKRQAMSNINWILEIYI